MKWRITLALGLPQVVFAFYPFNAEDTGTLGGLGKFQVETNFAYFKYYDRTKHRDAILQLTAGVLKNADIAVLVPYSQYKYPDGSRLQGVSDVGVFIKHIPLELENNKLGYKAQVNLDTGKEGIGYGKTTANLNLMLERKVGNITLNTNLVYIKASHVEELRDAYGAYLHAYGDLRKWLIAGVEFKYLIPEEESVDKKDMHVLVGFVLRPAENTDIS
ncbi:MAG: hypothetical protein RMI51_05950, partial [Aquificaceae bacterium]|nr:hypothetical protein [Aquificaceae bacterium]